MIEEYCTDSQQIYLGFKAIRKLPEAISKYNADKILLVTSDDSFEESGASQAIKDLNIEADLFYFSDYSVNPKIQDAIGACSMLGRHKIDLIIAVGGGSTIDMAKIINIIQTDPENAKMLAIGNATVTTPLIPIVAIPTTAGTGSESTHFAVVYVDDKKYSLAHKEILPEVAILDPEFTLSAPPYLMACTGFDSLSQAVESLWAMASTEDSRAFAREAITLMVDNLACAIATPGDKNLRLNLTKGANLAGQAINISKTTAPHAISYPLTSFFSIPHGHAVALTLGHFFCLNQNAIALKKMDEDRRQSISTILKEYPKLFGVSSIDQCESYWYEYMTRCGLETSTEKLGVRLEKDIELIIENINLERLQNHPVEITKNRIRELFSL